MNRTSVLAAVAAAFVLGACAARAKPNPLAPYAGSWQGRIQTPGTDELGVPFAWSQGQDSIGTLTMGRDGVQMPTRILHAAGDSVVVEISRSARIPIIDPADVGLRFVGKIRGDSLAGLVLAVTPLGALQRGRVEAQRVPATASRR